jgi:hypothetical protein
MLITKMLVSAAIVLGSVWGAAPTSADPNGSDTQTNPFGGLAASSQETAPADGPAVSEELERGIRAGFSAQ